MRSFCPRRKVDLTEIRFFLAIDEIETPYLPEIDDNVSPDLTLCNMERD